MFFQKQFALVLSLFLMLLSSHSIAEGTYDARFLIHSIDCENSKLFFDIQIRAAEPGSEFYLTGQNYRFSFNRDALDNLSFVQELDVSGFVPGNGPQGFTFYSPHNLTGSLDTVASYNVEYAAGDGFFVESTDYVSVGRLCLTIVDFNAPVCMFWHTSGIFPPTFVGENINGMLSSAMDGFLLGYKQDFSSACNNAPPTAVDDSGTTSHRAARHHLCTYK